MLSVRTLRGQTMTIVFISRSITNIFHIFQTDKCFCKHPLSLPRRESYDQESKDGSVLILPVPFQSSSEKRHSSRSHFPPMTSGASSFRMCRKQAIRRRWLGNSMHQDPRNRILFLFHHSLQPCSTSGTRHRPERIARLIAGFLRLKRCSSSHVTAVHQTATFDDNGFQVANLRHEKSEIRPLSLSFYFK